MARIKSVEVLEITPSGLLVGHRVLQDLGWKIIALRHPMDPEDYHEIRPIITDDPEHVVECDICKDYYEGLDPETGERLKDIYEDAKCIAGMTVQDALEAEQEYLNGLLAVVANKRAMLRGVWAR